MRLDEKGCHCDRALLPSSLGYLDADLGGSSTTCDSESGGSVELAASLNAIAEFLRLEAPKAAKKNKAEAAAAAAATGSHGGGGGSGSSDNSSERSLSLLEESKSMNERALAIFQVRVCVLPGCFHTDTFFCLVHTKRETSCFIRSNSCSPMCVLFSLHLAPSLFGCVCF